MSFIPTEKIHLSKKVNLLINTNERMNNNSNLLPNNNPTYSSPFKKIQNNYYSQYSANLQMVNSPLNSDRKTLFYYPPKQYPSSYGRNNINLYQRNYYYMNNNNNENTQNIQNANKMNDKRFENKEKIKANSSDNINMNINMNVNNNVYHFCLGEKNNLNNNNMKIYSPNKYEEEKNKKKFLCRCKKSNCLKLYCDCFANGEKCIGCNCTNCYNVIGNENNIKKIYDEVIGKNPVSMKLNLQKESRTNGCNCSKSNCLKKYCECYKAGLKCSKICRCKMCENIEKEYENTLDIDEDQELNNKEQINSGNNNLKENDNNDFINNENNKNKELIDNDIINKQKKYDYQNFMFEKISILILNGKIHVQKYNLLKSLEFKDEFDNNIVLFSNTMNDINNRNESLLGKKVNRPK